MAKKKSASKEVVSAEPAPAELPAELIQPISGPGSVSHVSPAEMVKVNQANSTEVKLAFDDAVRKYLSKSYSVNHTYTDIHLGLGWTAALVAIGCVGWSTRVGFEESKTVLWVAVIFYAILSSILAAFDKYIVGDTIFVGKRKALVNGRIETTILSLRSKLLLPPPKPSILFPFRSAPSLSVSVPTYRITHRLTRSTNRGKSLLSKQTSKVEAPIGKFVSLADKGKQGVVDIEGLDCWIKETVEEPVNVADNEKTK